MAVIKRKSIAIAMGLALLVILWLFVGIYREREWRDLNLFLKYRPSAKLFFYSPLGEADRSAIPGHEGYLTVEQEGEEQAYVDFVEHHWLR